MRLFIAEKPSVGLAIAQELGLKSKKEGYIDCGDDKVTWCFGHLLSLAEPDYYTPEDAPTNPKTGKKLWRIEDLPIIPEHWHIFPKEDCKKQLKLIGQLLKEASLIINAGDSDREGQLLIEEVLEHFNNQKPVLRFWVSAHDSVSLQRGLAALKDNTHFKGLSAAAIARGRADWLIGMNLSRAYTLRAQRGGTNTLLTVGRVQTPTLALVVARDRDIEAFKPIAYHTLKAAFQMGNHAFVASWKASETQEGLDSEGRLIDKAIANQLVEALCGKSGVVSLYKQEPKTKAHPRAYSLSDITLRASNQFGFSAMQVLEACQSLYETHKLTSYPRTDCSYLPESQHADAPRVLEALKAVNPELETLISKSDTNIKSKTWNDAKVGAHYGIIPTMHKGSKASLNDKERAIYDLIVKAYVAQFYPVHEYLSTTVTLDVEKECFQISGKTITKIGWREVYVEMDEEGEGETADNQTLPPMALKDEVTCLKATCFDAKTKAPSRFSEGTLQRAMENIHHYISDSAHKKMLREGDGIGTSATRASIISELKRRNYLETKGRHLISTVLGRSIIDALPETLKSPILTAMYERVLKDMEQDATLLEGFLVKQVEFVTGLVAKANNGVVRLAGVKETPSISTQHKCASCNQGLRRLAGKKGFWWSCSGYPQCKQTYPDQKGRPNYNAIELTKKKA